MDLIIAVTMNDQARDVFSNPHSGIKWAQFLLQFYLTDFNDLSLALQTQSGSLSKGIHRDKKSSILKYSLFDGQKITVLEDIKQLCVLCEILLVSSIA